MEYQIEQELGMEMKYPIQQESGMEQEEGEEPVDDDDGEWETMDNPDSMEGILSGKQSLGISHHRGEFEAIAWLHEHVHRR